MTIGNLGNSIQANDKVKKNFCFYPDLSLDFDANLDPTI